MIKLKKYAISFMNWPFIAKKHLKYFQKANNILKEKSYFWLIVHAVIKS